MTIGTIGLTANAIAGTVPLRRGCAHQRLPVHQTGTTPRFAASAVAGGAGAGRVDYYATFMRYIVETGPADTLQALDEQCRRQAPALRGDLMACAEMLRREGRQEGELKGRREGRLEIIDGLRREGVEWPVIQSATGIDEPTYRTLKRDAANGTEQTAPR